MYNCVLYGIIVVIVIINFVIIAAYLLQINAKIFFIDRKCNVVCEKGSLGLLGKLRLIYIQ